MPIVDHELLQIAQKKLLFVKICRECGARNPPSVEKCRRCKRRNLRWRRRMIKK